MFATQIVFNAAAAQVRSRDRVGDRTLFRNHTDVACAIDEDPVPRQQSIAFIKRRREAVDELLELWEERLRKIANLAADTGVARGEARAGDNFAHVVDLL